MLTKPPLEMVTEMRLPSGLGGHWYGVFPAVVNDIKDPDGQGRIVIPQHLREWAGLTDEAVVVGVSRNLEVWQPARWRSHLGDVERSIGETLKDLGI